MTRPMILVVDDEPEILDILSGMLSDYRVSCANSVAEARAVFSKERWALVITDIQMPGPSGYSFISYVHERSPETPIFVITGYGESSDPAAALVSKWIKKPFRRAHVLAMVREVLGE